MLGGWLADRFIGARRSVLYGGIIIAAGHLFLTVPQASFSFLGIVLVALGTGLLKPNVSSMVGELYDRDDPRRDSGFSIFYMGINIGSLAAPFLVGAARAVGGYHWGFAVAAIGMAIALVFFVAGRKYLGGAGDVPPNPLTPQERPAVARLLVVVGVGVVLAFALAALIQGGFGLTSFIDAISYLAFAAPVATFVVMFRSRKVNDARADPAARLHPAVRRGHDLLDDLRAGRQHPGVLRAGQHRPDAVRRDRSRPSCSSRSTRPRSSCWRRCSRGCGSSSTTARRPP